MNATRRLHEDSTKKPEKAKGRRAMLVQAGDAELGFRGETPCEAMEPSWDQLYPSYIRSIYSQGRGGGGFIQNTQPHLGLCKDGDETKINHMQAGYLSGEQEVYS